MERVQYVRQFNPQSVPPSEWSALLRAKALADFVERSRQTTESFTIHPNAASAYSELLKDPAFCSTLDKAILTSVDFQMMMAPVLKTPILAPCYPRALPLPLPILYKDASILSSRYAHTLPLSLPLPYSLPSATAPVAFNVMQQGFGTLPMSMSAIGGPSCVNPVWPVGNIPMILQMPHSNTTLPNLAHVVIPAIQPQSAVLTPRRAIPISLPLQRPTPLKCTMSTTMSSPCAISGKAESEAIVTRDTSVWKSVLPRSQCESANAGSLSSLLSSRPPITITMPSSTLVLDSKSNTEPNDEKRGDSLNVLKERSYNSTRIDAFTPSPSRKTSRSNIRSCDQEMDEKVLFGTVTEKTLLRDLGETGAEPETTLSGSRTRVCFGSHLDNTLVHTRFVDERGICQNCRSAPVIRVQQSRCVRLSKLPAKSTNVRFKKPYRALNAQTGFFGAMIPLELENVQIKVRKFANYNVEGEAVVLLFKTPRDAFLALPFLGENVVTCAESFRFCSSCKTFHPLCAFEDTREEGNVRHGCRRRDKQYRQSRNVVAKLSSRTTTADSDFAGCVGVAKMSSRTADSVGCLLALSNHEVHGTLLHKDVTHGKARAHPYA